ncbi:U3 small nucleolar RNA-associated protein 5-like protein, partial [Drosera capensis]
KYKRALETLTSGKRNPAAAAKTPFHIRSSPPTQNRKTYSSAAAVLLTFLSSLHFPSRQGAPPSPSSCHRLSIAAADSQGACFMGTENNALETSADKLVRRKSKKKRREPDPDVVLKEEIVDISHEAHGDGIDGVEAADNEPTIAEKLATINLMSNKDSETLERHETIQTQLPIADSVQVLLKQALHADDRALLLDCLYNQDEKVIANSISLLNPADISKLLKFLISIIQLRGAVVVCTIPWLRSLVLQHASNIISQESSLVALNSLYQLIEARVSTLRPAVKLASYLDLLDAGIEGDGPDELEAITPIVFEDTDSEEDSEDAMDTDDGDKKTEEDDTIEDFSDVSDD